MVSEPTPAVGEATDKLKVSKPGGQLTSGYEFLEPHPATASPCCVSHVAPAEGSTTPVQTTDKHSIPLSSLFHGQPCKVGKLMLT